MRFPLLAKVGAIALVGMMVAACLARIEGLVDERRVRGDEAAQEVERSHAGAQALMGPLLRRSCTEEWLTVTGTGKDAVATPGAHSYVLQQVPARLAVDGSVKADPLHRGVYTVNAYAAHLVAVADFPALASMQPRAEHTDGRVRCEAPVLSFALSDVRGVRSATVRLDEQAVDVRPGTSDERYPHGFSAVVPPALVAGDAPAPLKVTLALDLIGTRQVGWVPAADAVRLTLSSDWPHPSFGGKFLPDARSVRDDGFGATWNLSALATTAAADAVGGHPLCATAPGEDETGAGYARAAVASLGGASANGCLDTMAVSFIDPVNPYVMSDRAVKYALLFVLVTFVAVGLIEVLSGRRVHPVQYLLVGLALSVFFLLLLSLSEHMPFGVAYGAASTACSALLGFYASAMFGRALAGTAFGLAIAALYGLLYALLQMEQNALAIGSVMLFAGLAVVMALTRRIDWYALFARLRAGADAPARARP